MPLDLTSAKTALLLCEAAYDTRLIPQGPDWSLPQYIVGVGLPGAILKESSTFGFAIQHSQRIHVVFRGTEDPGDWLSNIECAPVNGIHGGFYGIYAALQGSMAAALQSFSPRLPVEFDGHSLGGALATIGQANTPGSTAVTYAAPRCFTTALANKLPMEDVVRFVNGYDLVPHLPGRMGLWDYSHRALAYRFYGKSREELRAHSTADSYGPALSGSFDGPMELE